MIRVVDMDKRMKFIRVMKKQTLTVLPNDNAHGF